MNDRLPLGLLYSVVEPCLMFQVRLELMGGFGSIGELLRDEEHLLMTRILCPDGLFPKAPSQVNEDDPSS